MGVSYQEFLARKQCAPQPWQPPPIGPGLAEFRTEHEVDGPAHYIYGLYDPRTGALRYIGKSDRPRERLTNQMNEKADTYRCHWLQELRALGLRPIQVIIDAVPAGGDWQTVERAYILAARSAGHRLTNGTDGGDGVVNLSPEARARIRAAWVGRKHKPETREKIGAASRGRRHTAQWREQMREKMRGRQFSDEHLEKIRQGVQKLTVEQVREIRRLLGQGVPQRTIATLIGTTQGSVTNIARGKTYRDVR